MLVVPNFKRNTLDRFRGVYSFKFQVVFSYLRRAGRCARNDNEMGLGRFDMECIECGSKENFICGVCYQADMKKINEKIETLHEEIRELRIIVERLCAVISKA